MKKPLVILPIFIAYHTLCVADYIDLGICEQPIRLSVGPSQGGISGTANTCLAYETDIQTGDVVILISFTPNPNATAPNAWQTGDKLEFSGTNGIQSAVIYHPVDGAKSNLTIVDEPVNFDTKFYNTTYTYTCTNRYRAPGQLTGTVTFTATAPN
jgi:hypothetical protein